MMRWHDKHVEIPSMDPKEPIGAELVRSTDELPFLHPSMEGWKLRIGIRRWKPFLRRNPGPGVISRFPFPRPDRSPVLRNVVGAFRRHFLDIIADSLLLRALVLLLYTLMQFWILISSSQY